MSIYRKSASLSLLRLRLEQDRAGDWQELQARERRWFLSQQTSGRWPLVRAWVREFSQANVGGLPLFVLTLNLLGLVAGFSLIAGLLEFHTFERINLLWFLALAVLLPTLIWLAAVLVAAGSGSFPILALFEHRLPPWARNPTLYPLLRQTAVVLSQQVSLLFSIGMLSALCLYLVVTDLAFGWSSTLDIPPERLHVLTSVMSWPWAKLWPEAVPGLALVEHTRFFRASPQTVTSPAELGEWWRFLLMCLLVYVTLPRLVTYFWHRWRLARMQANAFTSDALIAGWWQRMTEGSLTQEAEQVDQLTGAEEATPDVERLPVCPHVVLWGIWPEDQWQSLKEVLHVKIPDFQLYKLKDKQLLDTTINGVMRSPDESVLILCKGWEPPGGELKDFCAAIRNTAAPRYIWPVPLRGMSSGRIDELNRSWRAFVPRLPDNFHLYLSQADD